MTEELNEETTTEETEEQQPAEVSPLSDGNSPEFKWYVVHVLSGFENRVKKTLTERIVNHKMTDSFAEIFYPAEEVTSNVKGKKRKIKEKFFPGYLLKTRDIASKSWSQYCRKR